jgi:hypothetical protein
MCASGERATPGRSPGHHASNTQALHWGFTPLIAGFTPCALDPGDGERGWEVEAITSNRSPAPKLGIGLTGFARWRTRAR